MPLSDLTIRNAKGRDKPYRITDAGGLYLQVQPNGGRYWRLAYRFGGKQKTLALGTYPAISLAEAREGRDAAKKQLARSIDPGEAKKARKRAAVTDSDATFEAVAREWLGRESKQLDLRTHGRNLAMMENHAFPEIGNMAVAAIEAPDLLAMADRIEAKGIRTARRVLQKCGQVFRFAIQTGRRVSADPVPSLKGAIRRHAVTHHAAITDPERAGALMRFINGYRGDPVTVALLRLLPLVFTRPGKELCQARWRGEIDLDKAEWRIPAERVKTRVEHVVPLSRQAVEILRELRKVTGRSAYVFASDQAKTGHISAGTALMALKRGGFEGEMTAHGFRAMADSLLSEMGYDPAWIDRQLAHKERNQVTAAYRRAQYLDQRREMMQAWADYRDGLS